MDRSELTEGVLLVLVVVVALQKLQGNTLFLRFPAFSLFLGRLEVQKMLWLNKVVVVFFFLLLLLFGSQQSLGITKGRLDGHGLTFVRVCLCIFNG